MCFLAVFFSHSSVSYTHLMTAEEQSIPLSMTGTFSGLSSGNDAEMNMTFDLDIDELVAMLEKENPELANDAEFKASIEQFKEIKVNAIANLTEGKFYLQMPLLNETFMGSTDSEDVWFLMDYNELMDQMGMGTAWESLLGMANANVDSTDLIHLLVGFLPLDSVEDLSLIHVFTILKPLSAAVFTARFIAAGVTAQSVVIKHNMVAILG